MPTASVTTANRPADLVSRLTAADGEIKLKALRELKNQIIGNRTKKLAFLKLGAIPIVSSILASAIADAQSQSADGDFVVSDKKSCYGCNIVLQSAAALGSFACGFDAGVQVVIDSGALPHLVALLSYPDEKVVDAGARSLRMTYQSKLTPKYEFLQEKKMEFLLSLLNSESENVSVLGASIIAHSCDTNMEQKALCDAGVVNRLLSLLQGSLSQRDASLEALAAIFRDNPDVITKMIGPESGRTLSSIIGLTKDRFPRTRLLAFICLIAIRNSMPCYLQDIGMKTKLVHLLLELVDDPGKVGDEAPFVFCSLISGKEDMQKLAFEANAMDKLWCHMKNSQVNPKRFQGILLAMADMCSQLEDCRCRLLELEALKLVTDALIHDSADVRSAACICLRSVARSIKNLCAGYFMSEMLVAPLVQLLHDPSVSVQVSALGAISNILVDCTTRKSTFVQHGGLKLLVQLVKSMDSVIRLNALRGLRNMLFMADNKYKEGVFMELTASLLASLVSDHDPYVQVQALALVRNLVDGCVSSVDYVFTESGVIFDAVGRQLEKAMRDEIAMQGMYVLANVASGNEFHKEAVMHQILPQVNNECKSSIIKFLQSNNSQLRTATVWVIVNLTFPSSPSGSDRFIKLKSAGVIAQIEKMVNDSSMDVKLRARTVMAQARTFGHGLA